MNLSTAPACQLVACLNTTFSRAQIHDCCSISDAWTAEKLVYDSTVYYTEIVSGLFGLVGSILTYLTLRAKAFVGPSCTYHRAIALFEIWHTAVMAQYGILQTFRIPMVTGIAGLWSTVFWCGWLFAGGLKTSISIIGALVSAERCVALWIPFKFNLINKRKVAMSAIGVAYLIGVLHWCQMFAYDIVPSDPIVMYRPSANYKEIMAADALLQSYVLPILKLIISVVMAGLSVMTVVGLKTTTVREATMKQGQQRWRSMKHLCYLQLLLAATTLLDHVAWASWRVASMTAGSTISAAGSFDLWLEKLEKAKLIKRLDLFQNLTGELVHCWRFYIYLVLHKKFRQTFFGFLSKKDKIVGSTMAGGGGAHSHVQHQPKRAFE